MSAITTYTGRHVDPVNPEVRDLVLEDIAHSLSLQCRGGGHVRRFFSVAQHCLVCASEARMRGFSSRVILGALLHDASEAYLCDVPRPIKQELPRYQEVEERLLEMIWTKYLGSPLEEREREQIREIDDDEMSMEFHVLMAEEISDRWRQMRTNPSYSYEDPVQVQERFLTLARELMRAVGTAR